MIGMSSAKIWLESVAENTHMSDCFYIKYHSETYFSIYVPITLRSNAASAVSNLPVVGLIILK